MEIEYKGLEGAQVTCPACKSYRGKLIAWDKEHSLAFIECDCSCLYVVKIELEEEIEFRGMNAI